MHDFIYKCWQDCRSGGKSEWHWYKYWERKIPIIKLYRYLSKQTLETRSIFRLICNVTPDNFMKRKCSSFIFQMTPSFSIVLPVTCVYIYNNCILRNIIIYLFSTHKTRQWRISGHLNSTRNLILQCFCIISPDIC